MGSDYFRRIRFFIRAWSDDGVATPTSYILFDAEKISRCVRATVDQAITVAITVEGADLFLDTAVKFMDGSE